MNIKEIIVNEKTDVLHYLKSKFQLIHNSNIFFRDFHYGLKSYLQEKKGKKLHYLDVEELAHQAVEEFEKLGLFIKIDHQSWRLNYPEFALPRIEKKVP